MGGVKPPPLESTELNNNFWNNLPEELQLFILVRLPVASIFKFRSVSKNWNTLLSCTDILLMCPEGNAQDEEPFYFMRSNSWFKVARQTSKIWNNCEFTALMPELLKPPAKHPILPSLESAAGGLLLMAWESNRNPRGCTRVLMDNVPDTTRFLINPFNKSFRKLPELPDQLSTRMLPKFVAMDFDEDTGSHKILMKVGTFITNVGMPFKFLGWETYATARKREIEGPVRYYCYDSMLDTWELTCALETRPEGIFDPQCSDTVFYKGYWYFAGFERFEYNLETGAPTPHLMRLGPRGAEEVPIPLLSSIDLYRLFKHNGRLTLAGGISHRVSSHTADSVCVWELNLKPDQEKKNDTTGGGWSWVERLRMPDHIIWMIRKGVDRIVNFHCESGDGQISFHVSVEDYPHSHRFDEMLGRVVGYSVESIFCKLDQSSSSPRNKWWKMPRLTCDQVTYKGKSLLHRFHMKPRLNLVL